MNVFSLLDKVLWSLFDSSKRVCLSSLRLDLNAFLVFEAWIEDRRLLWTELTWLLLISRWLMSMLLSFDYCFIVMKELIRLRNSLRWSFDIWLASRLSKVVRSLICTMLAFEFVFSITNKYWYSRFSSFENERYSSCLAKVCSICVSISCFFETSSIFESSIDIFFAKNLRDCATLVEEFDL